MLSSSRKIIFHTEISVAPRIGRTLGAIRQVAGDKLHSIAVKLSTLGMAEQFCWRNAVADKLLEHLDFRKTALLFTRPEELPTNTYFENAAGSGDQGDFADFIGECGEKFLDHPGRAQQPAALGAIFNLDTRLAWHKTSE